MEEQKSQNGETEWYVNRKTGEAKKTTKTKLRKLIYHKYGVENLTIALSQWDKASKEEAEILEKYPD